MKHAIILWIARKVTIKSEMFYLNHLKLQKMKPNNKNIDK